MDKNFENLLEEYKMIAEKLSQDNLGLDESIALYEKSSKIYELLSKELEAAQIKVENIREI